MKHIKLEGMGYVYLSSNSNKNTFINNLTINIFSRVIESRNVFREENVFSNICINNIDNCKNLIKDECYYIVFVSDKFNLLINDVIFKEIKENVFEFYGDFDNNFSIEVSRIGE